MNVMCMIGNMALIGAEKTGHLLGNVKNALKGNLCLGKVMNNFTKEELEEILEFVVTNDNPADNHDKLINKIQSIIDNYCDKECDHNWFECFYGDERIPIKLCSVCNAREKR